MGLAEGARALARVGGAARGVARVFRADASEGQALEHAAHRAALGQMEAEFAHAPAGWFDKIVDGLNRLPRPLLAFGTLGLFVFAMVDPARFAHRMEGLAVVPEPLWWLLGAIVGFYFGARELHHRRGTAGPAPRPEPRTASWHHSDDAASAAPAPQAQANATSTVNVVVDGGDDDEGEDDRDDAPADHNPALAAWKARQG